jgi:hypothetical protein
MKHTSCPIEVRWLLDRPVKPGDDNTAGIDLAEKTFSEMPGVANCLV